MAASTMPFQGEDPPESRFQPIDLVFFICWASLNVVSFLNEEERVHLDKESVDADNLGDLWNGATGTSFPAYPVFP